MTFEHETSEGEVLENTAKALKSKGYGEEEISEQLNVSTGAVQDSLTGYSEQVDQYELGEHEQEKLDIASEAGIVVDEAAEYAGVSEDVAIDYLSQNGELKLTQGKKATDGFTDTEMRIALEGFYDEWKNPEEITEKINEEGPYERSLQTVRKSLDEVYDIKTPSPGLVQQQENRLAEARGEEDTRFRIGRKTDAPKSKRDYEMSSSIPSQESLREETADYEVMGEIEDEEVIAWLEEQGLDQSEKVTAILADFDREIDDQEIEEYSEEAELSEPAEEVLEAKKERGDFKFV